MNIKALKPLVMMQLKDKIDMSFLKSVKQTITKIVMSILLFVLMITFTYLLLYLAKMFNIFSLVGIVPVSVLGVIFSFMLLLSVIACTYGLMQSLYFSRDNLVLLTYPVTPNMVFLSKLIVFYIYELKKTASFLLPLFISYGIVNSFAFTYFLWIIFAFILISAIPVIVGALLSIPAMIVTHFLKNRLYLQIVLFSGFLVFVFYSVLKAIAIIPGNLNIIGTWGIIFWKIQDYLNLFVANFNILHGLTVFMVGEITLFSHTIFTPNTLPTLGLLALFLGVVFMLSFVIVKPLFFKMSSTPFEFKTKKVKNPKKNIKRGKLLSSIRKEFVMNLRTTELIASNFLLFAILPIAIFLLNKIYAAMNTRLLGIHMTFSFNILLTLLIILSSNYVIASAFSKEGASGYLIKTKPASYYVSLLSKLIFNTVTITISLIVTTVILSRVTSMTNAEITIFFFTMLFVYIAHLVWSAEMDIMNPQNQQYATTGRHTNNPNENRSTLFAFLLAFMFFAISLFLFNEGQFSAWVKVLFIALALMIARLYLFYIKIKVY